LQQTDFDRLTSLRQWLQNYFKTEFSYELSITLSLNKIREFILNEQSTIPTTKYKPRDTPREFDTVARIDSMQEIQNSEEIMTGGLLPEIKLYQEKDEEIKVMEPAYSLKLSDPSGISFELVLPLKLLPQGLAPTDVIRIKSVVASTNRNHKLTLVPTCHSNILVVPKSFKLYERYQAKVIESPTKSIDSTADNSPVKSDILFTREICSTILPQFKSYPITTLKDALTSPLTSFRVHF
jgi:hypothetical protein